MIDVILQAGTKFALHQWLDARNLGENAQDTDPNSPTFGDYFYNHTDRNSTFIWWRHPSGILEQTAPVIDVDGNVTTPATFFNGFYGILRFSTVSDMENLIGSWTRNNTAVSILESFDGFGGEGITILTPNQINDHLDNIGIPRHEFLGGMSWSDPRVWWASPVMIGDQRTIDGITYTSLIDFNVWNPVEFPSGWEVVDSNPPGDTWTDSGATFEGVLAGGVINVSDTSVFITPEPIRIDTIEITANSVFTAGSPGVLAVSETSTELQFNVPNGTIIEVKR